jgi:hypothetical protein
MGFGKGDPDGSRDAQFEGDLEFVTHKGMIHRRRPYGLTNGARVIACTEPWQRGSA